MSMHVRPVRQAQAGFTLVELTVTMVLITLMSLAMSVFVINGVRTYATAQAKSELLAQAQTASDRIASDIMLAGTADQNNRIDDSYPPTAGNPNSWTSNASTLVLATAVENNAGNIVYADAANYISYKNNIVYYVKNKTLYRRVLAAAVTGNKARTTCPASNATSTCSADTIVLNDVVSVSYSYRDHLNQTVPPDEARSVEVSVVLQRKNDAKTKTAYTTRTVFRNE